MMNRSRQSVDTEILRLLKATGGGYVSGEELSRKLGLSRAAVWKHMEALRSSGYTIDARPRKGYMLAGRSSPFSGVEIASGLRTSVVGGDVRFFEETDSTNTRAFELARSGAPEGTVVVADAQSGGKGRIGRSWLSPPGLNLYASVILRPELHPMRAQMLTLMSAVAEAEAIGGFVPTAPLLKWPNDVLVRDKKVSGILLEMDSEGDRVKFVVAGFGVNVNMTDFPEELRGRATSIMMESGRKVSRVEFARRLLTSLDLWYARCMEEGFDPVVEAWRRSFALEGKPVRVAGYRETIEGICLGIDPDGALLVKKPGGGTVRVLSGDLVALRGVDAL